MIQRDPNERLSAANYLQIYRSMCSSVNMSVCMCCRHHLHLYVYVSVHVPEFEVIFWLMFLILNVVSQFCKLQKTPIKFSISG